jgi:hypothetical protein
LTKELLCIECVLTGQNDECEFVKRKKDERKEKKTKRERDFGKIHVTFFRQIGICSFMFNFFEKF